MNINRIIQKHSPLLAAALEHNKPTEINPENVRAAIKEIVEAIIDKCAEEAKVTSREFFPGLPHEWKIERNSILNVKTQINYS